MVCDGWSVCTELLSVCVAFCDLLSLHVWGRGMITICGLCGYRLGLTAATVLSLACCICRVHAPNTESFWFYTQQLAVSIPEGHFVCLLGFQFPISAPKPAKKSTVRSEAEATGKWDSKSQTQRDQDVDIY